MGTKIILQPGDKFGRLTVIEEAEPYRWKKTSKARWLCKCECGQTCTPTGSNLRHDRATECISCAYRRRPQSQKSRTPLERLYNLAIIGRCRNSGIKNELSFEDYCKLVQQVCYYCGAEPELKVYAHSTKYNEYKAKANGIDRINSSLGYSVRNCVPCCSRCNSAKGTMSQEDFLEHVSKIYQRQQKPN